jgi:hypothetical protein
LKKQVIKCECGTTIPYVPDVAAMQKAIDAHAETHRKIVKDCSKTQAANEGEAALEVSRIKEDLLKKATKIRNPKS